MKSPTRKFLALIVLSTLLVVTGMTPSTSNAFSRSQRKELELRPFYDPTDTGSTDAGAAGGTGINGCAEATVPKITNPDGFAKVLDEYVKSKKPDSPFVGLGSEMVKSGIQYGVNPAYILISARNESGFGTAQNSTPVRLGNNAFGRTATASQPGVVSNRRWYKYPSWKDSISTSYEDNQFSYIKRRYLDEGLTTFATIIPVYAPPSENDTAGYISSVRQAVQEIADLAKGSLDCSSGTGSGSSAGVSSDTDIIKILDAKYSDETVKSTIAPKAIVLHWWGGLNNGNGINELINVLQGRGLSVQMGVLANGTAYQLTPFLNSKASHAKCANNYAIGIEIEGRGAEDLASNQAQFNKVVAVTKYLMTKFNIPAEGTIEQDGSSAVGIQSHKDIDARCANPSGKSDVDDAYLNRVREAVK